MRKPEAPKRRRLPFHQPTAQAQRGLSTDSKPTVLLRCSVLNHPLQSIRRRRREPEGKLRARRGSGRRRHSKDSEEATKVEADAVERRSSVPSILSDELGLIIGRPSKPTLPSTPDQGPINRLRGSEALSGGRDDASSRSGAKDRARKHRTDAPTSVRGLRRLLTLFPFRTKGRPALPDATPPTATSSCPFSVSTGQA